MTVTASPALQVRLLDLAAIDADIARIAGRKRQITAGGDVEAATAERAAVRRAHTDARGERETAAAELVRAESDVQLVEQRLDRDRGRLATTTSPKDAQGFEQEIETLLRRRGVLEDVQLALMERLEAADAALAETEAALAEIDDRVATLQRARAAELDRIAAEHRAAAAARAAIVAELPADLVALYDRQRTRYGVGAALLRRGVSGGSNMRLTEADLAAVRAAAPDAVLIDSESGCILVRTDESGLDPRTGDSGVR